MTRRIYIECAPSPEEYCALFRESFGPLIAIRDSLAHAGEAGGAGSSIPGCGGPVERGRSTGPVEIPYEYLLVIARKAAASDTPPLTRADGRV